MHNVNEHDFCCCIDKNHEEGVQGLRKVDAITFGGQKCALQSGRV
jgi:hypothetical protein